MHTLFAILCIETNQLATYRLSVIVNKYMDEEYEEEHHFYIDLDDSNDHRVWTGTRKEAMALVNGVYAHVWYNSSVDTPMAGEAFQRAVKRKTLKVVELVPSRSH